MKYKYPAVSFSAIIATVVILFSACKKINESTNLGAGLIPPVDNITTFDTSISIQAFNDTFGLVNDSQYLSRNEEFFLGRINSDPFFGKTDARLFLELKPIFYKFAFANSHPDSLHIDSVVLVLSYVDTYGDTLTPQTVNVYEIDQSSDFKRDSFYLIRKNSFTYSNLLGSKTFSPQSLDDSVKVYKDTTKNQLRIRLNNSFGTRLLGYDSVGNTGAYSNDSVFRTKFKGFALQSMNTGEAVMGFSLPSINTKLAIYYRYEKNLLKDTSVAYFGFNGASASDVGASAAANYIQRDYSGTPFLATVGGPTPDPMVYIQNSPGSFATIKIPDLGGLSNRLIHRAELIVEQLYHPLDTIFRTPELLYLDASDPSITANYKFRTVPYDFQYTPSGFDLSSFGCLPQSGIDPLGNKIKIWKFNLSRYVQHVLTRTQSLYDLRLFAPFTINEQYGIPPGTDQVFPFFVNPTIVKGRIRVGGGNHPTQRMRLRLIYSKL
ncbi:MAG: DUF4270 family protein [Chitinophagaceae bacterium]|nr:DUF4270 family protein [Chitinophagaceae bacterium]